MKTNTTIPLVALNLDKAAINKPKSEFVNNHFKINLNL